MRIFSLAAAAICAIAATTAHAGVSGSALTTIENLTITNLDSGNALTASTLIGGVADINVSAATTTAINAATLSGGFGSQTQNGQTTVVANTIVTQESSTTVGSGDANVAFVGDAAAPANVELGADNFVALAGANGVRGDSSYAGSPVSFVDSNLTVLGSSAAASTYADFNVDQANLVGSASGDVDNTSSINFSTASAINIQISFDHIVELALTDYAPAGPSYSAFASSAFTISITEAGSSTVPPVVFFTETHRIDAPPFGSTLSHNESQTLTAQLAANTNYTLAIVQRSDVGFGVVPEPTSMAIFGFMGAGAVVSRRRRRK
jgi:uncharacterized protein YrrD